MSASPSVSPTSQSPAVSPSGFATGAPTTPRSVTLLIGSFTDLQSRQAAYLASTVEEGACWAAGGPFTNIRFDCGSENVTLYKDTGCTDPAPGTLTFAEYADDVLSLAGLAATAYANVTCLSTPVDLLVPVFFDPSASLGLTVAAMGVLLSPSACAVSDAAVTVAGFGECMWFPYADPGSPLSYTVSKQSGPGSNASYTVTQWKAVGCGPGAQFANSSGIAGKDCFPLDDSPAWLGPIGDWPVALSTLGTSAPTASSDDQSSVVGVAVGVSSIVLAVLVLAACACGGYRYCCRRRIDAKRQAAVTSAMAATGFDVAKHPVHVATVLRSEARGDVKFDIDPQGVRVKLAAWVDA